MPNRWKINEFFKNIQMIMTKLSLLGPGIAFWTNSVAKLQVKESL